MFFCHFPKNRHSKNMFLPQNGPLGLNILNITIIKKLSGGLRMVPPLKLFWYVKHVVRYEFLKFCTPKRHFLPQKDRFHGNRAIYWNTDHLKKLAFVMLMISTFWILLIGTNTFFIMKISKNRILPQKRTFSHKKHIKLPLGNLYHTGKCAPGDALSKKYSEPSSIKMVPTSGFWGIGPWTTGWIRHLTIAWHARMGLSWAWGWTHYF